MSARHIVAERARFDHLGIVDPQIAPSDHFIEVWEHYGITQAKLTQAKADIISGKKVVFRGPVKNQDGKIVIPDGSVPSDQDLFTMSYFVEGVEGQIPK